MKLLVRYSSYKKLFSAVFSCQAAGSNIGIRNKSDVPFQWSYVSCPGSRPLLNLTLGQLVDISATKYGAREALVSAHQNVRVTFAQLKEDVDKLASGFWALGLRPGDRIGIWGPNSYEWYLTQFAAGKAGLILVNINPAYRPNELLYCLNKVGIKAIVSAESFKSQDYYRMLTEIMPEIERFQRGREVQSTTVPSLTHIIMISQKEFKGAFKFDEIRQGGGAEDVKEVFALDKKIQSDDAVNIQFTSGTTGNPKGAVLSHHNIINNGRFLGYRMGYDKRPHRTCLPVPLYHCFGCVIGTISMLYHGGTSVLPAFSFNALESIKTVQEEKCTSLYGTPTMFIDMLKVQQEKKFDLSSLTTGIMSGAPCPKQLCKNVLKEMNMKDFVVIYGATETSPMSFQCYPSDPTELKISTIGYPSDHLEVKVVDEEGRVVPVGTPGELLVRGYSKFLGYWADEEKSRAAVTKSGWFLSGDLAVIHANGYGQIVGRLKDMVIRGGENLYPREIEEMLHTHPAISDVHVVGVPDERMGEELCAWIMLSNQDTTEEDIRQFCKGKLAHFKIPRYIYFTKELPITVTGKIQKFKIVEESIKIFGLKKN